MLSPNSSLPSYRLHKPTGQAVVTLSGVDVYLGKFNSIASRDAYDRAIQKWLVSGRRRPNNADATVNELILAYVQHVDEYYRKPDGTPTSQVLIIRTALKPMRRLFGPTPLSEFGPLELETVREQYVKSDLCRNECNRRVKSVVAMFKWGVSKRLVPVETWQALTSLAPLKRGRTKARESVPVGPVSEEHVDAVLPYMGAQIRAMVELQRLSGCRSGEIVQIRTRDLDMSADVWAYVPPSHKTEHHGKARVIHFGPRAIEILKPWLRADREENLFRPCDGVAERFAEDRRNRVTPLWPSHVKAKAAKRKAKPQRAPGTSYTSASYRRGITRAIDLANRARVERGVPQIPRWHPHQLRHAAATRLEREFGISAAQVVLGHSSPNVTKIYTAADQARAAEAMRRIG